MFTKRLKSKSMPRDSLPFLSVGSYRDGSPGFLSLSGVHLWGLCLHVPAAASSHSWGPGTLPDHCSQARGSVRWVLAPGAACVLRAEEQLWPGCLSCSQGERMEAAYNLCSAGGAAAFCPSPSLARCASHASLIQTMRSGQQKSCEQGWHPAGPPLAGCTFSKLDSASLSCLLTMRERGMQKGKGFCAPSILDLSPKILHAVGVFKFPANLGESPPWVPTDTVSFPSLWPSWTEVGRWAF